MADKNSINSMPAELPPPPPPPTGQSIAPNGAFPGSLTPGWNDPPTLLSENQANAHGRRPRLDLRKRVPFPMDASANIQILEPGTSSMNTPGAAAKPVAKVSPQPLSMFDYGGTNNNESLLPTRLPPLAPSPTNLSRVPVAKVPPRQK